MVVADIPKEQWSQFLEEFGRRHHGWLVQIEGAHTDAAMRSGGWPAPLAAITVQLAGQEPAITIVARQDRVPPGATLYSIPKPCDLRVEEDDGGREKRLVITREDGRTSIVRLHQVIEPPAWKDENVEKPGA
jgi:hypothetical protein